MLVGILVGGREGVAVGSLVVGAADGMAVGLLVVGMAEGLVVLGHVPQRAGQVWLKELSSQCSDRSGSSRKIRQKGGSAAPLHWGVGCMVGAAVGFVVGRAVNTRQQEKSALRLEMEIE